MSYRDDVEALQIQLTQLEHERAEILRDRARLLDAVQRIPHVSDEIERLRRQLHARAPRKLPVLEDIRVASPCAARWDDMTGDEQARFCGSCQKHVYNLSAMTREAAESLVRAKEGDLCVRFYRRADGTVLTADCAVGVRRKRIKLVAAASAVTALAAGAVSLAFAQMGAPVSHLQGGARVLLPPTPPSLPPTPPTVAPPDEVQGGSSEMLGEPMMGEPTMPVRMHMGRPSTRVR